MNDKEKQIDIEALDDLISNCEDKMTYDLQKNKKVYRIDLYRKFKNSWLNEILKKLKK